MCKWRDITFRDGGGRIQIPAKVISDACKIIRQMAQKGRVVTYSELMDQLKSLGHRKISRRTIGKIVGEVSNQVSRVTNPSIYPSAIVVRKDTNQPGNGFWGLEEGTNPHQEYHLTKEES